MYNKTSKMEILFYGSMEERMRILYLNTTYSGGGAEKVTRQVYEGMKARGHEVYEIVCYNRRGAVEDDHVKVLYASTPGKVLQRLQTHNRGNTSRTIPYAVWYICNFIKKHRIEVVHLHNPHDSFLGIRDIRTIQKRCPVVWTLHDFWALTGHCAFPVGCDDRWKTGCKKCEHLHNYPRLRKDVCGILFEEKKRALTGCGIHYTVPSDWMRQQFAESYLQEECCTTVYNSLWVADWKVLDKKATRRAYGIETDKFVLAFVAADLKIPQKGTGRFLEVLKGLNPDRFLLLMAGKCSDEWKGALAQFEVVDFGYIWEQQKMNEFYAMADLMVNPSTYETFGLVNIEAMASGTPVAAFHVCVMPEVISPEAGWLCEEISADAFRTLIQQIADDREAWKQKADACHTYVQNKYDEKKMLDHYEELYQNL